MKTCTKCLLSKDTIDFCKDKYKKDGLCCICKTCNSSNTDSWQKSNAKQHNDSVKQWQARNSDKVRLSGQKYSKNNNYKINAKTAKRNAQKAQRTPSWLTKLHYDQMAMFYKCSSDISKETGVKFEVDHVIPLQGENVSGLHVPWNLQVIPKSENCKKSNRY